MGTHLNEQNPIQSFVLWFDVGNEFHAFHNTGKNIWYEKKKERRKNIDAA